MKKGKYGTQRKNKMKRICIISGNPNFLGGVSIYTKNVADYVKKKVNVFWVYKGEKNRIYRKDGISFVELSAPRIYILDEIIFSSKIKDFLNKNYFDVINPHAIWGYWLKGYKRKRKQKIIHTYHGSTYHFYKNHRERNSYIKKIVAGLQKN